MSSTTIDPGRFGWFTIELGFDERERKPFCFFFLFFARATESRPHLKFDYSLRGETTFIIHHLRSEKLRNWVERSFSLPVARGYGERGTRSRMFMHLWEIVSRNRRHCYLSRAPVPFRAINANSQLVNSSLVRSFVRWSVLPEYQPRVAISGEKHERKMYTWRALKEKLVCTATN